jgi:hypothetical protein
MSTIQEALRIDHRIGSVSIRPFMDALGILRLQVKTQIGCIRGPAILDRAETAPPKAAPASTPRADLPTTRIRE